MHPQICDTCSQRFRIFKPNLGWIVICAPGGGGLGLPYCLTPSADPVAAATSASGPAHFLRVTPWPALHYYEVLLLMLLLLVVVLYAARRRPQ